MDDDEEEEEDDEGEEVSAVPSVGGVIYHRSIHSLLLWASRRQS